MAAGDRILVSSDAMEACIGSYQQSKMKMLECVATYATALAALATDYTGVAAVAMATNVNTMLGNIKASGDKIDDCIKELRQAIEIYGAADKSNATLGSNVERGNPFGN